MNLFINGYNVFFIVLITFISSIILTPIVIKISYHIGAIDDPKTDKKRRIHKKIMPTMGGLAIFLSFLIGYMLFAPKTTQMLSILIGGFIIVLMGIFDDINPVPAKFKLIGQIIAATVVVSYGNVLFDDMTIFYHTFEFGIFAYPLSIFFIVAIMNAINFADGLDGLAAGTSTIYFITIAIIGYIMNKLGGLDVILCLIMVGSCIGFLVYNFYPAAIFMGDTGSMFLGFIISVIALLGFKTATITSLIIPLLLLFVPILDTLLAMGRRALKGKAIFSADKDHVHHQLLRQTKSTPKTVLLMYAINILFACVSLFYTLGDKKLSMALYAVLLILFIILILKTNILYAHVKEETTSIEIIRTPDKTETKNKRRKKSVKK